MLKIKSLCCNVLLSCLIQIPKKTNQELREEGECSESDSESETDKINDTNKLEVPTCDKNSDEIEESSVKPIDEQTFINDYGMELHSIYLFLSKK